MSLLKLGLALGAVAVAGAIMDRHADDDYVPELDDDEGGWISGKAGRLMEEGYSPHEAYEMAAAMARVERKGATR